MAIGKGREPCGKKGRFRTESTIQRVHTKAESSPAEGCDESHKGVETKSSYTADYFFYGPPK